MNKQSKIMFQIIMGVGIIIIMIQLVMLYKKLK